MVRGMRAVRGLRGLRGVRNSEKYSLLCFRV
jgi:hypothetical protein